MKRLVNFYVWWVALTLLHLSTDATTASCESRVTVGDQNVGISAIEDALCKNGGLGCFSDGVCRYCQKFASPQSIHLVKCNSVSTATQAPATTKPPTGAPLASSSSSDCSSFVKKSTLTGISFVTDTTCNVARPIALGCTSRTSCRLCRTVKNEANQFLANCAALQKPKTSIRTIALSGAPIDITGGSEPNVNYILIVCIGVMALVVAIIGLAHAKICRHDSTDAAAAYSFSDTGLVSDNDLQEDKLAKP
ncbi:unnamed protein product [Phytophthora lilii]|uniref:Unnamed protein product n=1 Tax=Phytophthora lilii TaxID=2077276 RepID=A0A9W7D9W5_9STRA|nr:unnamed protein product [Phytophthora lilii]